MWHVCGTKRVGGLGSASCGGTGRVLYRPEVDLQSVRDAYSSMSEQYIGMAGDGSQEHEADVGAPPIQGSTSGSAR
jgi:hypothetical protein